MDALEYAHILAHEAHVDIEHAVSRIEDAMKKLKLGHPDQSVEILEDALRSSEMGQHKINDALGKVRALAESQPDKGAGP